MPDLTYHDCDQEDFAPMLAMASDWAVVRQLGRWAWPVDVDQVRSFCAPFQGDGFLWTIKENGIFAGRVGVTHGSIGYTLPQSAHGRGIATAACHYALTKAFDLLDDDTITASTWVDNPASARVLHKLGFVHWQTHMQRSIARRIIIPVHKHRLTRADWTRLNATGT